MEPTFGIPLRSIFYEIIVIGFRATVKPNSRKKIIYFWRGAAHLCLWDW